MEGKPGPGGVKSRGRFCLQERKDILALQRGLEMEPSPCGKLFKTCSQRMPTAENQKCRGGVAGLRRGRKRGQPALSVRAPEQCGFLVINAYSCILFLSFFSPHTEQLCQDSPPTQLLRPQKVRLVSAIPRCAF